MTGAHARQRVQATGGTSAATRARRVGVISLALYAVGWLLYALGLGVAVVADIGDARSYIPWLVPVAVAVPGAIALQLARLSHDHLVGAALLLVIASGSGIAALVAAGLFGSIVELMLFVVFPLAVASLFFVSAFVGRRARPPVARRDQAGEPR